MYEIYEALKRGENFEANAMKWIRADSPNPFEAGSEARKLYFKAHQYYVYLQRGDIDGCAARKHLYKAIHDLINLNVPNPYSSDSAPKKEEPVIEAKKAEEQPEITNEELKNDVQYLLYCMVNAYNNKNEASYEMYVSHLLDLSVDNPFEKGTEEYQLFDEMQTCWTKVPPNKRRSYVVGKQLCELVNNTEIEPEKPRETILGVVPEEKKSWFKFLFPWKKEGEPNDSTGNN